MISSSQHTRIASFLARGLRPEQVSAIVGCTPAYISQLRATPEFNLLVDSLVPTAQEGDSVEEDILLSKHQALEHKILTQLESALPYAEVRDLTKALEVVGTRQDKIAARKQAARTSSSLYGPQVAVTVSLTLPAHAVPEYTISSQKEITAIGDRLMSPLSSDGVRSLFARIKESTQVEAAEIKASTEIKAL